MKGMKGLKIGAVLSFVISMLVLLGGGFLAKKQVAPYPEKVTVDGAVLVSGRDILDGQDVYQKYGLMDHGSVWGHGTLPGHGFLGHDAPLAGRSHAGLLRPGRRALRMSPCRPRTAPRSTPGSSRSSRPTRYDPATKTLALTPAHAYAYGKIREAWDRRLRRRRPALRLHARTPCRAPDEAPRSPLLLLDGLGGCRPPARQELHLHEQLAAGPVGRQRARRQTYIWSLAACWRCSSCWASSSSSSITTGFWYGEAKGVRPLTLLGHAR